MPDTRNRGEFGLIERYFKPLSAGTEGAFGLADDAGRLIPEKSHEHVLTCDALVQGVHFLAHANPFDIGYKALAVNVSDLCAKGAQPIAYLLAIALGPDTIKDAWLDAFARGLQSAQDEYGCGLLGGDTVATSGPTVITITAIGTLPEGSMVHRAGAHEDDLVFVTGTIGDATLGLEALKSADAPKGILKEHREFLAARHLRPSARLAAIPLVRDFASASMDVSDGLVGDFAKLASASGVGGTLNVQDIPFSPAAVAWLREDPNMLEAMVTGGDDYELLITVADRDRDEFETAARKLDVQISCIGCMTAPDSEMLILDRNGNPLSLSMTGYEHF